MHNEQKKIKRNFLILGESLGELQRISASSDDLVDQLVRNSQCQTNLALHGDHLLSKFQSPFHDSIDNQSNSDSINTFVDKLHTLTSKAMEDTLITIKIYENARYDTDHLFL